MRNPAHNSGFTLLELLVVMFIVGIIAAMATLSVGVATSEKDAQKEINHLADLLSLASEEAVLQGREFGLTFYTRQYEFTAYDPGTARWEPVADDDRIFALRKLPPDSVLELEIDGRSIKLPVEKPQPTSQATAPQPADRKPSGTHSATAKKEQNLPQIFVLSSGDVTPFTVHLRPAIGSPGIRLEVAESGLTKETRDEP